MSTAAFDLELMLIKSQSQGGHLQGLDRSAANLQGSNRPPVNLAANYQGNFLYSFCHNYTTLWILFDFGQRSEKMNDKTKYSCKFLKTF